MNGGQLLLNPVRPRRHRGQLHPRRTTMSATKPKGLTFTAGSHRYRLDGKWVPGATTVIGVLDKPALPKWAAAEVATYVVDNPGGVDALRSLGRNATIAALKQVPWQKRDDAAARGTTFHDFAERIANGEQVEVPDEQVGLVESALAFMDEWSIKPVLLEQAVGSREHSYAGTLDLVADHNRGPRAIFDWKSGKHIYSSAVFQLNAYAYAEFYGLNGDEHPMADLGIEAAYGVHIRDDGYDVHSLAFGPDIFDEFLTIRRAFDINKRAEGDWKVPGSGYVGAAYQQNGDAA